jgi:hypothetical protein
VVERDRKQFAALIVTLAEIFNDGKEPSQMLMKLYWESLKKYEIQTIEKAVSVIIQTRVYPSLPKPAEIIQEIEGKAENRATEAWIQTLTAIRRIGTYRSVKFSDPVIHAVIQFMGGWSEMGNILVDDEKWKQKEFERLYPIMEARGNHPDYLPGRLEVSNEANGFIEHIGSPVLIGEFEQCEIKRLAN